MLGDDDGGGSSKLQGQLLDASNFGNHLSHAGGAGEGDLVDPWVSHQLGSNLAAGAIENTEHTRGQTRIEETLR